MRDPLYILALAGINYALVGLALFFVSSVVLRRGGKPVRANLVLDYMCRWPLIFVCVYRVFWGSK